MKLLSKLKKSSQSENGRSMVEMLGVLAIIGVLSIGGIAGYTHAMRRYLANGIIDIASKYEALLYTTYTSYGITHENDYTDYVPLSFCETGLAPEISSTSGGKKCGIHGTALSLDGLVSSLHLHMVFSDKKMCKMVATILDEECLSSDAIEMYFDFEEE